MPWPVAITAQCLDSVQLCGFCSCGANVFVLVWVHEVYTLEVHFGVSGSVKYQLLPSFWVETSSLMVLLSLSVDSEVKGHWKTNRKPWYLLRNIKHSNGPFIAAFSDHIFLSKLAILHFIDMHLSISGVLFQLKL